MRQLGKAADTTADQLGKVDKVADSGKVQALVTPMSTLKAAALGLAGGLAAAFSADRILAGMTEMKDRAEELELQLTRLLQIEGEVDPERRRARQERF